MSKIKLPSLLQGSYEPTDKVIGQRFEHSYLGKIDLSKINETMAKKLVRTGHLKELKTPKEKEKEPEAAKKEPAKK